MPIKDNSYQKLEQEIECDDLETSIADGWRRRFCWLSVLTVLLAASTGLLLSRLAVVVPCSCYSSDKIRGVTTPYSPAAEQIRFVNKFLTDDPESARFMGEPRPEVDEAWHQLLRGTMIRVSAEELAHVENATSVAYEKGGYVAGLGISHSLHCLKRVKQFMHPKYYYPGDKQNWDELSKHAEHCLESIRQSLMCQPDISLYTMEWTSHSRVKPSVRVPQPHVCVDWSRLHEWMIARGANWDYMSPPPAELYDDSL